MTNLAPGSPSRLHSSRRRAAFALAILLAMIATHSAQAQTFTILHTFGAPGDGASPISGLVADQQGNLYGQTDGGGPGVGIPRCPPVCGTVFELSPNGNGNWSESILHYFNGADGAGSAFEPPVFDGEGNLYGVTGAGGAHGDGTVFELTPGGNGHWSFSSLHSFANGSDGYGPSGIAYNGGTVYTTQSWGGGENDEGVVTAFAQSNNWQEQTLHDFNMYDDGWLPEGLVFDSQGNAYGTTFYGGVNENGTVYKLTYDQQMQRWNETIIHKFVGIDGGNPAATLVFDAAGNLYSTTLTGGLHGGGTVFELSPHADGTWGIKVLFNFPPQTACYAGVTFDQQGNLYGVTEGSGYVYKLSPAVGQWQISILHQFNGSDGAYPFSNVILDSAGNIYGTTANGGRFNQGVAFEVSP